MSIALIRQRSKIQSLLEQGTQRCLDLTERLQRKVDSKFRARQGLASLSKEEILYELNELAPELYWIIGETLFRLIPLLQPDARASRRINFYFWPGYHSYLTDKRIFIKEPPWNFGVGFCGSPASIDLDSYRDCSQARWYHYLIASGIIPGDVHRWFRCQRPRSREAPYNPIGSLTATTQSRRSKEEKEFPDHVVRHLPGDSPHTEGWGELFSEAVRKLGSVEDETWAFPGPSRRRLVEPERWQGLQSKMQSIWLHSAFHADKPRWLDGFIEELLSSEDTAPAARALQSGLMDPVASDWGDRHQARPRFVSWTNLALHSWIAPPIAPLFDFPSAAVAHAQEPGSSTVGSAALLSSVFLRPSYLAEARFWVSSIYGMVRNAEISILLQHQIVAASTAMLAGPWFQHELKKVIDEGLETLSREVEENNAAAIRNRRFVFYSLRTTGTLAYDFSNAVLLRHKDGLQREKERFLDPLRHLHAQGTLLQALRYVAEQAYECVSQTRGGSVRFTGPEPKGMGPDQPDPTQYRSCFLLVVEMIRNYCEYESKELPGTWKADINEDRLTLQLEGTTDVQRNPASMTFIRLDAFLRALGIGEATVTWDRESGACAYIVQANLSRAIVAGREAEKLSIGRSTDTGNR